MLAARWKARAQGRRAIGPSGVRSRRRTLTAPPPGAPSRTVDARERRGGPKTAGVVPSGFGFALVNFSVQRASVSFCAALAGCSGQISSALWPSLIAAFSASVFRCRGARTILASEIRRPPGWQPRPHLGSSGPDQSSRLQRHPPSYQTDRIINPFRTPEVFQGVQLAGSGRSAINGGGGEKQISAAVLLSAASGRKANLAGMRPDDCERLRLAAAHEVVAGYGHIPFARAASSTPR